MLVTAAEILKRARTHLDWIHEFIDDISDATKRQKAFSNVIILGRTVTFIIQNLKSIVGDQRFNDWYAPFQIIMRDDELLVAFKDARNEIEKQGKPIGGVGVKIDHLQR